MKLKYLGLFSAFILIVLLVFFNNDLTFTASGSESLPPCEEPLTYRLGNIDPRFDITEQQLLTIMKEVEDLWAMPLKRNMIKYDPNGEITVRLIYSEEQQHTKDERRFAKRIEKVQGQISAYKQEYEQLAGSYKKNEKDFKAALSEYNKVADTYNQFAEKWRGQNISDSQANKLKKLKRQIDELRPKINRKQKNLESLRKQTNAKSRQLNQLIDDQNELIDTYNNRFGGTMEFDQGHFVRDGNSESIRIYQFANRAELKAVLAHEVGHALGLQHAKDPTSIMYHMMGKQNIFDLELTSEDIAALKKHCNR